MSSSNIGDLVWAKLKGFSPWPGRISLPTPNLQLPKQISKFHCIYFFGTHNYGFVRHKNVKPYNEFKEKMLRYCNTAAFKAAINEIEEYMRNPEEFSEFEIEVAKEINGNNHSENDTHDFQVAIECSENDSIIWDLDTSSSSSSPRALPRSDIIPDFDIEVIKEEINDNERPENGIIYGVKDTNECSQNGLYGIQDANGDSNNYTDAKDYNECSENGNIDSKNDPEGLETEIDNFVDDNNSSTNYVDDKDESPKTNIDGRRVREMSNTTSSHAWPALLGSSIPDMLNPRVILDRVQIYECDTCGQCFLEHRKYRLHILLHSQRTPVRAKNTTIGHGKYSIYKCEICNAMFALKSGLVKHSAIHERSPNMCEMGGKGIRIPVTNVTKRMANPRVIIDRLKIYECEICRQSFLQQRDYRLHSRLHTQRKRLNTNKRNDQSGYIKKYNCNKCPAKFVLKSTLDRHSAVHDPFQFYCNCGLGYYRKDDFDCHVRLVHPQKLVPTTNVEVVNESASQECAPKKEPTSAGLWIDERIDSEVNKCDLCDKKFTKHHTLMTHIKRHIGIKDFVCNYCQKAFVSLRRLNLHKDKHKKHKCEFCARSFVRISHLHNHMRLTHNRDSGIKVHDWQHECKECGEKFIKKRLLTDHLNSMHDEKKYEPEKQHLDRVHIKKYIFECDRCGVKFSNKMELVSHIRSEHFVIQYCAFCLRKFFDESEFLEHRMKCMKEELRCHICHSEYKSSVSLKSHLKHCQSSNAEV